uniref:Uncharacterized protein n=1 Tax=Panagrolaimus sp. PS1159 TaxID=55785 RepID=A0AC35G6S8_9BILA
MSMPSSKIVIDPKWNFEITSNSENPVLIAFENFDGEFSSASPALLMAFIVKNMLKIIQKSTKITLNQIGIYLIDKNENGEFNKNEKERIENGFQEACKLLKIEYASSEEISKTRPLSEILID